jgi:aspartate/methionine/tyrosine aminotransferase
MPTFPAPRLKRIAPFHVMELLTRAKQLEAQGRDIIHMEVGEPDFPTPPAVVEAARARLSDGRIFYTPALGLPELRQAIADFYLHRYRFSVPASRIVVTAGASGALLLALACLAEPGGEWLLCDPGYPCNANFIRGFEGVPVGIPVLPENAYQPTPDAVERHWSPRASGALLASPTNPTGTLIGAQTLREIAAFIRAKRGCLIVDEIYHGLTYGRDADTALEFGEDIFVVQSFSKYFNMTGWRLGWLVVPEKFVRDIEKLAQNFFISPSTPAQYAALAAFTPETLALLEERRAEFQRRRDFLIPALEGLGFRLHAKPEGAFYIYADCGALSSDSARFARDLLESAGVATTPGIDFGVRAPETHLRFAYAAGIDRLEEAVARIRSFIAREWTAND